jgi:hypothetical protein
MPLPRYERVAQDLAGNALGGASVEVFNAGSTSKPTLYSDEDGNNTKSNPFTADSTGYFFFYVADGVYDVKVTYGATSVTYQNQQIFHPANRVSKSGDTMTGALTLAGDPTANLHAATKQYIDSRAASKKRSMVLVVPGNPAAGAAVSIRLVVPCGGTITAVKSTCRTAPSSGTYTYDILKNGSTIYTTTSNRPTRTSSDGTGVKTHSLPNVTSFSAGDVFTVDLVSAGSGISDVVFFVEFDEA